MSLPAWTSSPDDSTASSSRRRRVRSSTTRYRKLSPRRWRARLGPCDPSSSPETRCSSTISSFTRRVRPVDALTAVFDRELVLRAVELPDGVHPARGLGSGRAGAPAERRDEASVPPLAPDPTSRVHPGRRCRRGRLAAMYRGERFDARSHVGAIALVLRLCWASDAFAAQVLYRLKACLQAKQVPLLPRLAHHLAMALSQVSIGDPVIVEPGVYLVHGQVVVDGLVRIGSGTVISPFVTIGLRAGDIQGPTIDRDVHIGTGAKLIGPVHVGAGPGSEPTQSWSPTLHPARRSRVRRPDRWVLAAQGRRPRERPLRLGRATRRARPGAPSSSSRAATGDAPSVGGAVHRRSGRGTPSTSFARCISPNTSRTCTASRSASSGVVRGAPSSARWATRRTMARVRSSSLSRWSRIASGLHSC